MNLLSLTNWCINTLCVYTSLFFLSFLPFFYLRPYIFAPIQAHDCTFVWSVFCIVNLWCASIFFFFGGGVGVRECIYSKRNIFFPSLKVEVWKKLDFQIKASIPVACVLGCHISAKSFHTSSIASDACDQGLQHCEHFRADPYFSLQVLLALYKNFVCPLTRRR